MKLLLIQPPQYYHGKSRKPNFFPIGIGYIAGALAGAGVDFEVLDIYANQYSNEEVAEKIKSVNFDIVGISAMSTQYSYVRWLTSILRRVNKNAEIILGGALASFSYETVLRNTETDICVIGEGEKTVVELIQNLGAPEKVNGVCFKRGNELKATPAREYIKNLDKIAYPGYGSFPMDIYLNNSFVIGYPRKVSAINIISGRGCPFGCNYCSKVLKGRRLRSIDNVIDELKHLKEKYGINGVFFNDELITLHKDRVYELCDKIAPLGFKWNCQGRVGTVDLKMLKYMKNSGCTAGGYGIESGSQTILDNMNKGATVKQAEETLRDTLRAGLEPIVQVMFGYPGETETTIQETIDFFNRVGHPGDEFSPVTTLPGTELWNYTLKAGLIKDEKEFLEKLDGGYMPDAPVLVNYTSFSDTDYDLIRKETEKKIRGNYYKKHPLFFLSKYFLILKDSVRLYGYKITLMKIVNKLSHRIGDGGK